MDSQEPGYGRDGTGAPKGPRFPDVMQVVNAVLSVIRIVIDLHKHHHQ